MWSKGTKKRERTGPASGPRKGKAMKIGIISDTHGLLRPEVISALRGCGCILHGGDVGGREILEQLEQIAPVRAVLGNNDWELSGVLPPVLDFELGGFRICMAHRKRDLPKDLAPYGLAVCGHSHQYSSEWLDSKGALKRTLLLNPGSCGPVRFGQPVTMAVLEAGEDGLFVERIDIAHKAGRTVSAADCPDIRAQIRIVIRETGKGRTADEICARYGIPAETAEQIARLYVTHPGVTEDGIMAKMGL